MPTKFRRIKVQPARAMYRRVEMMSEVEAKHALQDILDIVWPDQDAEREEERSSDLIVRLISDYVSELGCNPGTCRPAVIRVPKVK